MALTQTLTADQLLSLSSFLNTQADLPVDIQEIADLLKDGLTPVVETAPVEPETAPQQAPTPAPEEVPASIPEVAPEA